jgi:MFS family permease
MYPAMLLAAGGLVLLASAGQHAEYFPTIFLAFLMLGVGAGASFMPLLQIGMSEIPNADAGLGSGIVNVSQQMAAAVGLAVLSTIATNRTRSLVASGHELVHSLTLGYELALYIAAGCVLVGLALAPFLLRTNESPEEERTHIAQNMQNPETYEHLVL